MGWKSTFIKPLLKRNFRRVEHYRDHPVDCQKKWFKYLESRLRETVYAKELGYQNQKAWNKTLPITDYEGLWPFIEKMMDGQSDILWPGRVKWYSKSSGTTSAKSKYIPVSKENLDKCHFMGGRDILACYFNAHPKSKLLEGKSLIMGGSTAINKGLKNSYSGDVSAVMLSNTPAIANLLRAPSRKVALMENWDEKIEAMIAETQNQNISSLAGVPTWTLVLIKQLFERKEVDDLRKIWNKLELYIHGGVSFTPYRNEFEQLIPHSDMHYIESYNASEGFIAYQDEETEEAMLLMTDNGIYFEFVPMSEWGSASPIALNLEEVEMDKDYALIMSSNAGLWRYAIGDTIRFTSLKPYRIIVSGRTKHFINVFGEEVMVHNTDAALAKACKAHQATIVDYTVAPIFLTEKEKGGHEWIVAFENAPRNLEAFIKDLDEALQSLNGDYEAKRFKDMALRRPRVHAVPHNTFDNWLRSKGKVGGQNKVPRLSNSRDNLESILSFVQQRNETT